MKFRQFDVRPTTVMHRRLREEIEAENEEVKIPTTVRWLGRSTYVKARYRGGAVVASSITFAILTLY